MRMIKPNLIDSHDWHVQPYCQRSLRAFRLSGALWIEAQAVTPGCPRTCCAWPNSHFSVLFGRFCANFLNLSNFLLYVKHYSRLIYNLSRLRHTTCMAVFRLDSIRPQRLNLQSVSNQQVRIAAQNFKQQPASLEPLRLTRGFSSGSCNGLFSEGFPTGVQGYA